MIGAYILQISTQEQSTASKYAKKLGCLLRCEIFVAK